jgi:hypothetical protein
MIAELDSERLSLGNLAHSKQAVVRSCAMRGVAGLCSVNSCFAKCQTPLGWHLADSRQGWHFCQEDSKLCLCSV